ncbi:hypothetical protein [Actinomyces bowdenii]|uniref:DUF4190 domain-containing protein n=1 Tax=Actinomyces bowdenii TaxID=131109 RepID=A0A3P1UP33_9ACTO|nr:hypothetical protein [Actinomyces bowdenii]RRD23140.1 hypothetical protein EII10_12200 [Actinomyces bowdenii]
MDWAGITSLILALASPVIAFILSPLGLIALVTSTVLGIIGLSAANQGRATNKGMALAGLITSVVLLVLGLLVAIIAIVLFGVFISESSQTSY